MKDITTAAAVVASAQKITWGRKSEAGVNSSIGALLLVLLSPALVYLNWVTLYCYGGSISAVLSAVRSQGWVALAFHNPLHFSSAAVISYAAWLLWQALLYGYLPGELCFGQRTPGGHLLSYTANGVNAWALTHLLYLTASVLGFLDPAIIAKNWEGLLVAANAYGFVLAIISQLKGYFATSFPGDRKMSGSWIFDFWAGVELNPRFGQYWDFKFFHNGRPGIGAWILIDLSFAAYQYQSIGYVTRSMLVVIILHTIYVVDFFYNESWYTRTIDISHDHFGFMLAWGDTTFLPAFYTLQAQYLAQHPVHLTQVQTLAILAIGLTGYSIFRLANCQRDQFRAKNGQCQVWGAPAKFINCTYRTSDGKEHNSILLTSGWWGFSRHANYLGDLILTWAMCAPCGFKNILPWFYFFYMVLLLNHRAMRDERRCHNKYGKQWEEYCAIVPYRLIPGVY